MDKPTIVLNGKTYEMKTPKAKLWRVIVKFNEERRNFPVEEFIEEHAKIIAAAFDVEVEEVLSGLDVDEVLPTYFNIFTSVLSLLTAKLAVSKKNAAEEVETQV